MAELTQKKAKEITLEVWRYLRDHPETMQKNDLPEKLYIKIIDMRSHCPLCEFLKIKCSNCPLWANGIDCYTDGSLFELWLNGEKAERKKAASQIVELVEKW